MPKTKKTVKQSNTKKLILNKNEFLTFLESIALPQRSQNTEVKLSIIDTSISGMLKAPISGTILALKAHLSGKFLNIGDIGIQNLPQLINYVEVLSKEFEVFTNKNKLSFVSGKQKLNVVMSNPDDIVNTMSNERFNKNLKLSTEHQFILPKETIKNIKNKIDLINASHIILKSEKNKLYLLVDNLNLDKPQDQVDFSDEYEVKNLKKEFIVSFSGQIQYLKDMLSTFDDDIIVGTKIGRSPLIYFKRTKDNLTIEYILACDADE